MSVVGMRFCGQPPRGLWLKPEIPQGSDGAMIGWIQDAAPVDGGVPQDVARVIAEALVKNYRVTFVDPGQTKSPDWQSRGDYSIRFVHPDGIGSLNPSAGYALTSTRSSDVALRLFDTEESLWTLQSQVVFLTDQNAEAPDASFRTIDILMRTRTLDVAGLQGEFGCWGIVTPGPDGDFAQMIVWQAGGMDAFKRSLRFESEVAGLHFAEVSSLEFEHTKWFLEKVGS
jgi:hypothetical protein